MVENRMRQKLRWLLPGLGVMMLGWLASVIWPGTGRPAEAETPGDLRIGGSGFLVAPGLLVTNAHVVLQCRDAGRPLRVSGTPGIWHLVAEENGTDLALLSGPASADTFLSLSAAQHLPPGLPVMLLGYPTRSAAPGHLQGRAGQLRQAALTVHDPQAGRAVSFTMTNHRGQPVAARWEDGLGYFGASQAGRLRWQLEIDAQTGGGSSGGPVLDAVGNVVGVIYAGSRIGTAAVPLPDLRQFLARTGVTPHFRLPAGDRVPDWPGILRQAEPALRRLAC
jgi:S1-C subfamily serine protease